MYTLHLNIGVHSKIKCSMNPCSITCCMAFYSHLIRVDLPTHNVLDLLESLNLVNPDSKVHRDNTGPTSVLSAPDGPHVGPMHLAIRGVPWPCQVSGCCQPYFMIHACTMQGQNNWGNWGSPYVMKLWVAWEVLRWLMKFRELCSGGFHPKLVTPPYHGFLNVNTPPNSQNSKRH